MVAAAAVTSSSAPRRRIAPRGGIGGAGGRSGISVTRPPILIELSERYIKVGHVGQAASNQMILLPPPPFANRLPSSVAAEEWYRYYAPLLEDALSFVQDVSVANKRRVVVVHHGQPHGPYPSQREALERLLLQTLEAPAAAFVGAAPLAALSVAEPHHVLVVYLCPREAHCLVVSNHRALDFTYRATGRRRWSSERPDDQFDVATLQHDWEERWRAELWDVASPHSLARCVAACLDACPREIRRDAASSLLLAGEVWDGPRVARRLVRQVQALLLSQPGQAPSSVAESEPRTTAPDDDPAAGSNSKAAAPPASSYTHLPVSPDLRALVPSVAVIQVPHVRPDALPWLGASVWAWHWWQASSPPSSASTSSSQPPPSAATAAGSIPWITPDDSL